MGYAGDLVYLALEHVRGETLDEVLSAQSDLRLSSLASLHLTRRLAQALSVVHEIGLQHGDLRPGNVLIPAGGGLSGRVQRAKILDFGTRDAHPDSHPARDIRALGALLLRTLSGCEPPLGRTVEEGMLREWLADQPEVIDRLIRDMMATASDAAGRRSADAVVRRIDRILEKAGR